MQILLIAGHGRARKPSGNAAGPVVEVEFTDRMDLAYAAADLVVSRSGAGIMELAAAGLPSILIPYPYARDQHQAANARAFAAAGAAVVVADDQATPERLDEQIRAIAGDPERLRRMTEAARALARPDAAADLASIVLDAAEGVS